ncbi:uncharacterized protein LOC111391300 [Olea europaea var. sylvestris]|uniref:uncharacterized protein LOC111391300 n=1 Tax=Olea europaea var. sylvestris TaxID=158386 RepID=UPI000C1D54B0|nr:uncharacterized protein LOC111391300 [Olea europaea var. sylvestris]
MTQLTRKGTKFVWSEKCEQCFQELKDMFISAPVTIHDGSESFVIYSDASKLSLGCILIEHGKVKANIVADALSRKKMGQLLALCTRQDHLIRDFENSRIEVLKSPVRKSTLLASFTVKLILRDRIVAAQKDDPLL